jgi:REP element-mobilizing transposase RayT
MSTFTKLTYHIVFGTKYRKPIIHEEFKPKLYAYIGGIIRSQDSHLIEIGGIEDHIHLLVNFNPKNAVSDLIRDIKANSSKWSNETITRPSRFEWQKGFGAFTVSYSQKETVSHYIRNQREHHKIKTFEEEYVAFLKLHDINFDYKYLFENEIYS